MFKYRDPWYIIFSRLFLAIVFFTSSISVFLNAETYGLFTVENSTLSIITQTPHFYALKITEFIVGVCFLSNFFVPTALLLSIPITISAIGFHLWSNPVYALPLLILFIPIVLLVIFYRDTFSLFFNPQIHSNHLAEDTPKILTYDEVREKRPGLEKDFEEIYIQVHKFS